MGDVAAPTAGSGDAPFVSLYRRFRPGRFEELQGQPHVVLALQGAVRDDHVSHAYLFSGPRGTGKTSSARILAKALNCAQPVDGEPCGVCPSCVEIAHGTSLDVFELDAASNSGVDAMRDLVSHAALGTPGRWKVYIVDEVHMLSTAAANALLKTLEEPPGHVVFVLATTDPQKVPVTIKSRTQHLEFRLIGADTLHDLLRDVGKRAGLDLTEGDLSAAVRRGRGSARDALSALDQAVASGSPDGGRPELLEVMEGVYEDDAGRSLVALAALHESGWGPQQLATELVDELRQAFLVAMAPELAGATADEHQRLSELGDRLGLPRLVRAMEVLGRAQVEMRDAPDPRVVLEVALVRLARADLDDSPAAVLDRVHRLERALDALGDPRSHPADASPGSGAPPLLPPIGHSAPPAPPSARPPSAPPRAAPPEEATPPPPAVAVTESDDEGTTDPTATPAPVAPLPEPVGANGGGAPPDRDALTQAWGDQILRSLPARAKALFSAGRFIETPDATVAFALPNAAHRDRAEEVRPLVEDALRAHFGVPVPLTLVVDADGARPKGRDADGPSGAPAPGRRAPGPRRAGSPAPAARDQGGGAADPAPGGLDHDDDFDPDQPGDDADVSSIAESRLLEAFPGAQEVSE
jgi:DNA polymerase-3 subunit gamma/tau